MKIAIASDVHLEFGGLNITNTEGADVLVLAGDIFVENKGYYDREHLNFFEQASKEFKDVIYITGNHEYYNGNFPKVDARIQELFDENGLTNIHFLRNSSKGIGDVTFIGGTLWTDMNKGDELTLLSIQGRMSDFRRIRNMPSDVFHKFTPQDSVIEHRKTLNAIDNGVKASSGKVVVVGHHAPSTLSISDAYKGDTLMNGGFASDLSEFILDRPRIKLWVHGHMHDSNDYMIGDTRVVCNPRGYIGHESQASDFELKYVEV